MAAVTPRERQCELGSYYPAGTFVEAATSQSRSHVACNGRQCAVKSIVSGGMKTFFCAFCFQISLLGTAKLQRQDL